MARRLFIAFVLCTVAAVAFWIILPRIGANMPWFVPLLAYTPMLLTGLSFWLNQREPVDGENEDDDAVAGRIGSDERP